MPRRRRSSTARLRGRCIEDFDLIEMVALRLKELPPLVDGGFYDGSSYLANGISGRFDLKRYW
jgi:type IV secretory pathway VirB3-like protein